MRKKVLINILAGMVIIIALSWGDSGQAQMVGGAYGFNYTGGVGSGETTTYDSTAKGSILAKVATQIAQANEGSTIIARFPYITDIRVANALCEAANRGVNVMVLMAANPGIKNYKAPAYLDANGVNVYLDSAPGAANSTINYIVLVQNGTSMILTIPPDPKLESLPAGLLTMKSAISTCNALRADFSRSLENTQNVTLFHQKKPTTKN